MARSTSKSSILVWEFQSALVLAFRSFALVGTTFAIVFRQVCLVKVLPRGGHNGKRESQSKSRTSSLTAPARTLPFGGVRTCDEDKRFDHYEMGHFSLRTPLHKARQGAVYEPPRDRENWNNGTLFYKMCKYFECIGLQVWTLKSFAFKVYFVTLLFTLTVVIRHLETKMEEWWTIYKVEVWVAMRLRIYAYRFLFELIRKVTP